MHVKCGKTSYKLSLIHILFIFFHIHTSVSFFQSFFHIFDSAVPYNACGNTNFILLHTPIYLKYTIILSQKPLFLKLKGAFLVLLQMSSLIAHFFKFIIFYYFLLFFITFSSLFWGFMCFSDLVLWLLFFCWIIFFFWACQTDHP